MSASLLCSLSPAHYIVYSGYSIVTSLIASQNLKLPAPQMSVVAYQVMSEIPLKSETSQLKALLGGFNYFLKGCVIPLVVCLLFLPHLSR